MQSNKNIINPQADKKLKLYRFLNLSKNIVIVYKKVKGKTTMAKTQTTEFDNEMKALSMGVYKGNEKSIPKDWIKVSEYNKRSGFHGEAFKMMIFLCGEARYTSYFFSLSNQF